MLLTVLVRGGYGYDHLWMNRLTLPVRLLRTAHRHRARHTSNLKRNQQ